MGYFDLVKRRDENLAPESTADEGAGEAKIQTAKEVTGAPSPGQMIQGGADVYKTLLANSYNQSKESLERQRKAALLGDLATVFGQTVASKAGARQFKPVQSNVAYYNNALDKLRDNYNNTLVNYSLMGAKADREAKAAQDQLGYKFARDAALAKIKADLDAGLLTTRQAHDKEMQVTKAKNAAELAKVNNEAAMQRAKYTAGAAAARQKAADEAALERKKYEVDNKSNGGKTSNLRTIRLKNEDGTEETVAYDKSKEGAILSLYADMKKLSEKNPAQYGSALEDIELKFGEGGTRADKAMTIISQRLRDFPEMADRFRDIIGEKQEKKQIPGWGEEKSNKKNIEGW